MWWLVLLAVVVYGLCMALVWGLCMAAAEGDRKLREWHESVSEGPVEVPTVWH